jgi:hypothetical protein
MAASPMAPPSQRLRSPVAVIHLQAGQRAIDDRQRAVVIKPGDPAGAAAGSRLGRQAGG